ncbi:MAG: hypothetical protein WKF40_05015 [Thermoleophilaceae bacterium]
MASWALRSRLCVRRSASSTKPTPPCCPSCAKPRLRSAIRSGPFARVAGPFTDGSGQGGEGLRKAQPGLTASFDKLNRLFNIGAFNPNGAEGLTGNLAADREREEGYLYHLAWTAQNTVSLFNTASAQGPLRRIFLGNLDCTTVNALVTLPEGLPQDSGRRRPARPPEYAGPRWSRKPPASFASARWSSSRCPASGS